ncbi:CvpA family protein [Acetobacter sp. AN02]|uniref:CvpA family protein n=1 Tax=Acetobacter sp. AN02 TaxID=2894186 RepID=UPI0024342F61|nr:CvpA family protein [Acetobacter sp. AN02]MDG6094239.1 CvpA family protein [Acetobacter sp. AN02]
MSVSDLFSSPHVPDAIIGAAVVFSAIAGLIRGAVKELVSLLAWAGGLAGAWTQGAIPARWISGWVTNQTAAHVLAFIVIFLLVFSVIRLGGNVVISAVRTTFLSGPDHVAGLAFGLARGALIMLAIYLSAGMVVPQERDLILQGSLSEPLLKRGSALLSGFIPGFQGSDLAQQSASGHEHAHQPDHQSGSSTF